MAAMHLQISIDLLVRRVLQGQVYAQAAVPATTAHVMSEAMYLNV
jgi:hypothetical protein